MISFIRSEPNLIALLLQSVVVLGTSFGLALTPQQSGSIDVFVYALLSVVCRQMVTPKGAT